MLKYFLHIFFCCCCFHHLIAQELLLEDCRDYNNGKYVRVKNLYEDNFGFIWLSRGDGFYRFDGKDMDFINPTLDPTMITNYLLGDVLQKENGDYWFAGGEGGLSIYRAAQDTFIQIKKVEYENNTYYLNLRKIIQLKGKNFYFLSGVNGVWKINESGEITGFYRPISIFKAYKGRHNPNEIRVLEYDEAREILWIGGHSGLYSIRLKENDTFRHHPMSFSKSVMTNVNKYAGVALINDIKRQGKKLIIATWSEGILRYDTTTEQWEKILFEGELEGKKWGLGIGSESLLTYDNNDLLILQGGSSVQHLGYNDSSVHPVLSNGRKLPRSNGALRDRLGYIWITHMRRVCRYRLVADVPKAKTNQLYIRGIQIDSIEQETPLKRWDGKTIQVKQEQKEIEFTFRAINPLSYSNINYEYRLKGKEKNWNQNGLAERISYSELRKGKYDFQVRTWDEQQNKYVYSGIVKVIVEGKDRTVAYLIIALIGLSLLSLIGFLIYRYVVQNRSRKTQERYQKELREVQDAALRSQMNPHFLFNSLNSIRYFIVTNDNRKAANYLTKFSRLIRLILENSKKKLVSLEEELELLRLYVKMEQIRFEEKFAFEINLQKGLNISEVLLPPMLIQPYIENAILHGINPKEDTGLITLEMEQQKDFLIISIKDDGIGRVASQAQKKSSILKKKSLGMNITKTRLGLMDNKKHKATIQIIDLYDEDGHAVGTKVVLCLPVSS